MKRLTKTVYFTTNDIQRKLNWNDIHACDNTTYGMIEQVSESVIAWHSIKPCDLYDVLTFIRDYFKLYSYEVDTYLQLDECSEIYLETDFYISENNQILFVGSKSS